MKNYKLNILIVLFAIGLTLQSCNEDTGLIESEELLLEERGGPRGGGPRGGGPGGQQAGIRSLENDVLYEWTNLMLEIERYATGMRPNASARAFAYIYLASYETAIPGMRDYVSNEQRLDGLDIEHNRASREVDWELALNTCLADVMGHFIYNLPSEQRAKIEVLEKTLEEEYLEGLNEEEIEESKEWGSYVAQQVITYSQTDQAAENQILAPQPLSYEPPTADGYWTYSADPERALFPYWGSVRTFIVSPDETSTVAPIEYSESTNSLYYRQMRDCYEKNNEAKEEDGEQLWIAEFWSDDVENLMFSPPARQYSISNQLLEKFDVNLAEALELYVKLGFSLNDAAVATWKYKYDYMVMRPNVYIHEFIDPDFQTNLYRLVYWPNPSFPGYPSGHSTFASAAAGIFIDFFGNNNTFVDRSHEGRTEFRGAARSFNSFRSMARENAFSRVPLGVHMEMDCAEGLRLGYEISDEINDLRLRERPNT